jgi:WD40 repeat protein
MQESGSSQSHPIKNIHLTDSKKTDAEQDEEMLKSIGLDFSPHKTPISAIASMGQSVYIAENQYLTKFNLTKNSRDWQIDCTSQVWSLAASSNGEYVAMAQDDGNVFFLSSESGDYIETRSPGNGSATGVLFSPDSSLLLCISSGGTFAVFNTNDNLKIHMNKTVQETSFISLSINPDNSFGFSGAANGKIVIWNIKTKSKIEELSFHIKAVSALACDMQTLYSASFDGIIGVWDYKQARLRSQISNFKYKIFSMVLNSKGTFLYFTDVKRFLKCYDVMKIKVVKKIYTGNEIITALAIDEENDEIYAVSGERTIKRFDVDNLALKGTIGNLNLTIATITNDKHYLVCAFRDGWVKFISLITGNVDHDFYYMDGKAIFEQYPELGLRIEEVPEENNNE